MNSYVLLRRNKYIVASVLVVIFLWYALVFPKSSTSCNNESAIGPRKTTKVFNTFMILIVLTGPRNKDRRDAMRQTWLSEFSKGLFHAGDTDVSHLFVVGTNGLDDNLIASLRNEQSQYHDILLLRDFADAYEGLTEKLGKTLIWVNSNVSFKYLFKCDDDTYARIDIITNELKTRFSDTPTEMLYLGYFYGKGKVKKSGPWKETEWRLCDMYIPYARGGGYILTPNIVVYIAENFPRLKMYLSEDVTVGSWLAPLKVNRVHDKRYDTEYKSRGCSNTFVVSHKQSINDMRAKHVSLKKTGLLCEKEFSNFHGYEYDWDVPPSQCCVRKDGIP